MGVVRLRAGYLPGPIGHVELVALSQNPTVGNEVDHVSLACRKVTGGSVDV